MATDAERKAGAFVATADIIAIAKSSVPPLFEKKAEDAVRQHPELVQKVVDDILAVAEKARAKDVK